MKSNFLVQFFIFLNFYSLFPGFSEETVLTQKAYVINTNGIVFFKNLDKKKEKFGVIDFGEEVQISINKTKTDWLEIKNFSLKGFLPNFEFIKKDFIVFKRSETDSFLLVQQNQIPIFSKPFQDSNVLASLNQFEILKILSISDEEKQISNKWIEVEIKNKESGFLQGDIALYETIESANEARLSKRLMIQGFVKVLEPTYLKELTPEKQENSLKQSGHSKKGEFLIVNESKEINGKRYFQSIMQNPSKFYKMQASPVAYNDSPLIAWIAEKNVHFYTNKEFTELTIENSKSKVDKFLMRDIAAKNPTMTLNFENAYLLELGFTNSSKKTNFFIAKLTEGYTNTRGYGLSRTVSFIIQKIGNKYKVFSGNIENRGKIDIFDLDDDGMPEIYSHMDYDSMSRVAFTSPVFYGYLDGVYKEIKLPGNFLDSYRFENNILYLDTRKDSKNKVNKLKYRYQNGKFVKIK